MLVLVLLSVGIGCGHPRAAPTARVEVAICNNADPAASAGLFGRIFTGDLYPVARSVRAHVDEPGFELIRIIVDDSRPALVEEFANAVRADPRACRVTTVRQRRP